MLAETKTQNSPDTEPGDPSMPLYAAGLVVTLAGLECVNLTSDAAGSSDTSITLLLAVIGFVFSVGCRLFRIRTYLPEILGVAGLAYFLYGIFGRGINPIAFIQGGNTSQVEVARALGWAMVAMSWALVSDGMVVFMGLLSIAAIGVIGSLNQDNPVIWCFAVYIFGMLFLLVHHHYLHVRALAPPQEQQRDPWRPVMLQAAVAAICTLAVFLAGSFIIVPEEMLFSKMSLAQAIRSLAGGSKDLAVKPSTNAYVSDDPDFSVGTGQGWSASAEVVAHVVSSDHRPHYWRARTYDHYTGVGWTSSLLQERISLDPVIVGDATGAQYDLPQSFLISPSGQDHNLAPAANRPVISSQVDMRADTSELFYVGEPLKVAVFGTPFSIDFCKDGNVRQEGQLSIKGRYAVASAVMPVAGDPDAEDRLRHIHGRIPSEVRHLYLGGLSNEITTDDDAEFFRGEAAKALESLGPNQRNEYDRALAIQNYVAKNAVYSLTVPALTANSDHVREFLGSTHKGYCDMFASSVAVLCRAAGIPSRIATGFASGVPAEDGFDLRSMDKHAWVEVFFPGEGWVILDATTDAATDSSVATPAKQSGASFWQAVKKLFRQTPTIILLIVIILGIVGYVVFTEVKARRGLKTAGASHEDMKTALGKAYLRLTAALGWLGLERRPSETPSEFLQRITPLLPLVEKKLKIALPVSTLELATARFVDARYGGLTPDMADLPLKTASFVSSARRGWLRFHIARLANRGRKLTWS